jgi:hypothetical protein
MSKQRPYPRRKAPDEVTEPDIKSSRFEALTEAEQFFASAFVVESSSAIAAQAVIEMYPGIEHDWTFGMIQTWRYKPNVAQAIVEHQKYAALATSDVKQVGSRVTERIEVTEDKLRANLQVILRVATEGLEQSVYAASQKVQDPEIGGRTLAELMREFRQVVQMLGEVTGAFEKNEITEERSVNLEGMSTELYRKMMQMLGVQSPEALDALAASKFQQMSTTLGQDVVDKLEAIVLPEEEI